MPIWKDNGPGIVDEIAIESIALPEIGVLKEVARVPGDELVPENDQNGTGCFKNVVTG